MHLSPVGFYRGCLYRSGPACTSGSYTKLGRPWLDGSKGKRVGVFFCPPPGPWSEPAHPLFFLFSSLTPSWTICSTTGVACNCHMSLLPSGKVCVMLFRSSWQQSCHSDDKDDKPLPPAACPRLLFAQGQVGPCCPGLSGH